MRARRTAARPVLTLAVAGAVLHSFLPAAFILGAGRHTVPRAPPRAAAAGRPSWLPRAARGGESQEGFAVGDKVQAVSPDDEQLYPGTVEAANDDGTYTVRWDDPDGGPETNDIEAAKMKKVVIFKDYAAGDDVQAVSPDDGRWYPGVVAEANADGTFKVRWDDPDGGPESADVKPEEMKKVTVFKGYKADEAVEARYPDDGEMYPGTVLAANADGTFQVKWDDADGGPADSQVSPKDMRYPPIPVEQLEAGQKFTGTVRSVRDFGAFVDIGATGDGLVHISRMSRERVESVYDYVEEGQEIEVWVTEVRDDGKFGLTMVEGLTGGGRRAPQDVSAFADVAADEWLDGRVSSVAPFGAFVTVTLPDGTSADGLVHLSRIREGFVDDVYAELDVGQEVKVRVESVDLERQRVALSMREGGGGGGAAADLSAFEGLHPDEWLTGTVARTAPFGAFVTVTTDGGAKADGLVHITQIKDGFVESVEDELQAGQEVQVRVVSMDAAAGRMGLSMKAPEY